MPQQFFSHLCRTLTLLAWGAACLAPDLAAAALGEPETSIQGDVAKFQGKIYSTERLTYRVHEISLPSGTLVREFVAQSGAVFAVAWHGPTMPNLRQALGRYFDDYVSAAKTASVKSRRLDIARADLVVHSSGHMRAFSGIAYLPAAIPSGVSVGELQ